MITYWEWFKKDGWKKYTLPFLFVFIFITAPIYFWNDFSRNGVGATVLESIPILGFATGIIYLSIGTYNKSKYPDNEGNLP